MDLIKAPDGVSDEVYEKITWMQIGVIRKARKIKQGDIADVTGIKQTTLSHIEHGRMVPSTRNQHILATYFNRDDWHDNDQFDWNEHSYSTNNLTLFIHELQSTIDWSGYHHLVAEDIGMSKELVDVLKSRSSLLKAKVKNYELEAEPAAMMLTAPDVKMTVNRKRIPLYSIVDTPKVFSIEQTVQIIPDEAELITTPPMVAGIDDAYAMIVPNHLMHPAYGEGDTVFVHTGRMPQNGDDVVVRLTFEDREIAFIRSIWDTNARDSKEGEPIFFDLISYAQRDIAKMHAAAKVGDPEDLGAIVDLASQLLKDNYWSLTGYKDGRNVIAGTGLALPKITDATVDVIVGCQRKMGNEYGRGKFGSGPFGG
jgi:transcriptional regulator with XRE-family HTH domain